MTSDSDRPNVFVRFGRQIAGLLFGPRIVPPDGTSGFEQWHRERIRALDDRLAVEQEHREPKDDSPAER